MNPARRKLLGGIPALAVPILPAAARGVPDPDAALLNACAAYMKAERAWQEALAHAAARDQDEPLIVIIETPARTNAGRRAKADAVRTRVHLNNKGEPQDHDEALLWSLCDDLAAAGGET
jgi:hypothetical protein